ncbi:MAG: hypothetical protein HY791_20555 [Deltaproteobacteria bacterium]|nr:hypothetical protein [Deltaproteobacteria bacterium]
MLVLAQLTHDFVVLELGRDTFGGSGTTSDPELTCGAMGQYATLAGPPSPCYAARMEDTKLSDESRKEPKQPWQEPEVVEHGSLVQKTLGQPIGTTVGTVFVLS